MKMKRSLTKRASSRRLWTRLNLTAYSRMSCLVCTTRNALCKTQPLLTTSIGLQQEQPQLYENLTKILNVEEQQVLQAVFHEADAKAMEAANAQAAAAAAGMTTNGQ